MKILRLAACAATLALFASSAPLSAAPLPVRNDYANSQFATALAAGLKDFYARNFDQAQREFETALNFVPDNTLAISFLNAAASHVGGGLDVLTNVEEDAAAKLPKDYDAHVRLGFSYLFAGLLGRDRTVDAREELNNAVAIDVNGQAARVGLGIMRSNERSANRAKTEFLAALRGDPNNVLAREYLGTIYQVDLRNPDEALKYVVGVPNLVPGYADIQFHLASIMQDLKLYDEAIRYAKAGIDLDTGRVGEAGQHGYVLIAQMYLAQKKLDQAKKYLQQAVTYDADGIYAKKLLDKIAKGDYNDKSAASTPQPKK